MKSSLFHILFLGCLLAGAMTLFVQLWMPAQAAPGATWTVNDNGDAGDLSPGDGACDSSSASGIQCTLRAAIQEANALAGHDTILLGTIAISPASPLPALTDGDGATIKGNNITTYIDGNNLVSVGLSLESDHNVIQGLLIWNFTQHGIRVWWSSDNLIGTDGDGAGDSAERNVILHNGDGIFLMGGVNRVSGNYIGVFGAGASASPNGNGIYVEGALDANCETVIGTNGDGDGDAAEGNLISGNTNNGIYIHNSCVTVAGNRIGLNAAGTEALPNARGILVDEFAPGAWIGVDGDGISTALERNVISGNSVAGIEVSNGASQITIAGNYIGLNPAGDEDRPNSYGIYVNDSNQVTIGANDDGSGDDLEGNVISGNANAGILIAGADCTQNTVAGNRIGTNSSADSAIPNGYGIVIESGAHGNLIGDDGDGQGDTQEWNLISGNQVGVLIADDDTTQNTVAGNWIGTNHAGNAALANAYAGVHILGAPDNLIGGQVGNLISGNLQYGIVISDENGSGNVIAGNKIGTDGDGMVAIPNGVGIRIYAAPGNLIGTDGDGIGDANERNVISGNTNQGIEVVESGSDGNIIAGNDIGLNTAGNAPLKNGAGDWGYGISISDAPNTLIGTDADGLADAAERNVISGNNVGGVQVFGEQSQGAILAGNYIGTDASGLVAIPNGSGSPDNAVLLFRTQGVRIGTNSDGRFDSAERNVISGNLGSGIRIYEGSGDYLIAGNYIGVNANGSGALGNSRDGIFLQFAKATTIGGALPASQNVIANNDNSGIAVGYPGMTQAINNILRGNAIYANTGLGIDLGSDAVSANDLGDGDSGPNELQNYPVLSAATGNLTAATIEGDLNSSPSTTFWLDFYANPTCDPSGYGEGKMYLGSYSVATDPSGNASFSVELPRPLPAGSQITATATGVDMGSTSEFSQCIAAEITGYGLYLPLVLR